MAKTTSLQEVEAARMSLNSSSPETVDREGSGPHRKGPPRSCLGPLGIGRGGRVLAKPGHVGGRDSKVGEETIFLTMGKKLTYIDPSIHLCVYLLYICIKHPLCVKQY